MASPTLVKLEINGEQAKAILDQQFQNMILKLTEAREDEIIVLNQDGSWTRPHQT